jgi:hypothetical protein
MDRTRPEFPDDEQLSNSAAEQKEQQLPDGGEPLEGSGFEDETPEPEFEEEQ